jgi:uncharacterized integral membrane protein
MNEELCRFEMIYPLWAAWVVLSVGAVILIIGIVLLVTRVASGSLTIKGLTASDIYPAVVMIIGLVLTAAGLAGLAAINNPLFARRLMPDVLSARDPPVSADLTDKPLGEIADAIESTYYVVRLSSAARGVKISGVYRDALCDADLIAKICRNNSDKLTCDYDRFQRTLRVCPKADDATCLNRAL